METGPIPLADAATALGVHYMTAYRYVRTGALAAHQVGGRWVVTPSEIERFRHGGRPSPGRRAAGAAVRADPERIERLIARLLAADETGAWAIVEQRLVAGWQRADIVKHLLVPVMAEVGDRWEAGIVTVADEHIASGVMLRLLARLGAGERQRGRRSGSVVIAGVSGERHALPLSLTADVLRDQGLHVVDLGADTPVDDIVGAARAQDRLVGVGLCATSSLDEPARGRLHAAATGVRDATGCPVLVGGAAVGSVTEARELGGDSWSSTIDDVVAWFADRAGRPRDA
jgi:excisionase family DNA binding protein